MITGELKSKVDRIWDNMWDATCQRGKDGRKVVQQQRLNPLRRAKRTSRAGKRKQAGKTTMTAHDPGVACEYPDPQELYR